MRDMADVTINHW